MERRTYLAATASGLAVLGGCTTSLGEGGEALVESGPGEYPHEISADFEQSGPDQEVDLRVSVSRGSDQIFEETYTVAPDAERTLAGITEEELEDDPRSVTVLVTDSNGNSASEEVTVTDCLGDFSLVYREDGSLKLIYGIC